MNDTRFKQDIADIITAPVGDADLYRVALTHGSHGSPDYQRLEFLGDRVLGITIATELFERFPDMAEGRLAQMLNILVSGSSCADHARKLGLGELLLLGKQAHNDGARDSDKILGDVMESLIGALYRDQGFEAARAFILRQWEADLSAIEGKKRHPKSALQEWAAEHRRKPPVYELIDESGPAHQRSFTIRVEVAKVGAVEATASSKQAAETEAAKRFLEQYI